LHFRSRDEIGKLFAGLTLVEPGLVFLPQWHPEGPDEIFFDQPARAATYGAVGRKPSA
jgi:hypothetical protein